MTAQDIRVSLAADPTFLQHCVSLLLAQQLQVEREWNASTVQNGKGVSAADAQYIGWLARVPLYPELQVKAARKVGHYAKQLSALLADEQSIPLPSQPILAGSEATY